MQPGIMKTGAKLLFIHRFVYMQLRAGNSWYKF